MAIKSDNSIEDLNIPQKYKDFINEFIYAVKMDSRVKRIILFGSCAKGNVRKGSDIDILITTIDDIGEEAELDFYDYLPDIFSGNYVPCDLLIMPDKRFEDNKNITGVVQKYIYRDGVDLFGLLQ